MGEVDCLEDSIPNIGFHVIDVRKPKGSQADRIQQMNVRGKEVRALVSGLGQDRRWLGEQATFVESHTSI